MRTWRLSAGLFAVTFTMVWDTGVTILWILLSHRDPWSVRLVTDQVFEWMER